MKDVSRRKITKWVGPLFAKLTQQDSSWRQAATWGVEAGERFYQNWFNRIVAKSELVRTCPGTGSTCNNTQNSLTRVWSKSIFVTAQQSMTWQPSLVIPVPSHPKASLLLLSCEMLLYPNICNTPGSVYWGRLTPYGKTLWWVGDRHSNINSSPILLTSTLAWEVNKSLWGRWPEGKQLVVLCANLVYTFPICCHSFPASVPFPLPPEFLGLHFPIKY